MVPSADAEPKNMTHDPAILIPLLAILIAASASDLHAHRIPNLVTLGGAGLALSMAVVISGPYGLLTAFVGMAVGLIAFLPLYLKGGMAAGDVKLMAAAGAYLGPAEAADAVALSLVAGAVFGVGILMGRGGLSVALKRYLFGVRHFVTGGVWLYLKPSSGEAAATRFPYAMAIAAGTGTALALPPIFPFSGA